MQKAVSLIVFLFLSGCQTTEECEVCPICTNDILSNAHDVALEDAENRLSECLDKRFVLDQELKKLKEPPKPKAKAKSKKKTKK